MGKVALVLVFSILVGFIAAAVTYILTQDAQISKAALVIVATLGFWLKEV